MSATLVDDPLYLRLKSYVIELTGLAYYWDKDADLARRLYRRFACFGITACSTYLDILQDSRLGPAELEALIAEITIPETYFFRHREHFDALRDVVLPDLIARNTGKRRLRVWCAGCADGAEPYSLSILLRRETAIQRLAGWEVTILGTDINRQCLSVAREAKYEEWSLRSTPGEIRQACFVREGKRWALAPEYKEGVSFQFHNLVDDVPPLLSGFDLVICRNVMIYFGSEQMRRVLGQFHQALAPGAWLLVGPSEPNMSCFRSFRIVNAPGVTLYQREAVAAVPFEAPALPPCPALALSPVLPRVVPSLTELRRRADQGEWEEAVRGCRQLLEADSLNPLAHFHYALVLEQMGSRAEAERFFRRTIYLDRQSALAHYHLGLLLRSRGDARQAARSFENTLGLLASRSDSEALSPSEEITVAELRKMTLMQMETLAERV